MSSVTTRHPEFNRPTAVIAAIILYVAGPATWIIMPIIVAALAGSHGFSEGQLGIIASADLTGTALAALTGLYWRDRWNWRFVVPIGLLGASVFNYLSIGTSEITTLYAIRVCVGLCAGMTLVPCLSFLSYTRNPDRVAALMGFSQVIFIAIAFAVAPDIVSTWGADGVYVGLAIMMIVSIVLTLGIPSGPPVESQTARIALSFAVLLPGIVVLLANGVFQFGIAAIWSFIQLMGENAGLGAGRVGMALAITTIISLAGPAAAAIIGDRFGRFIPIAGGTMLMIAVLIPLGIGGFGLNAYFIYILVFQAMWGFTVPYQYGAMVANDSTKRLIILLPFIQAMGIAAGPVISGASITTIGYAGASITATIAMLLFAALILPRCRRDFTHLPDSQG